MNWWIAPSAELDAAQRRRVDVTGVVVALAVLAVLVALMWLVFANVDITPTTSL